MVLMTTVAAVLLTLPLSAVRTVSNAVPRVDTDGNIVDAHSGNIVEMNGTYFLYGEFYDMTTWTFHGLLHNNSNATNWAKSGLWPTAASDVGQWWCPTAIYHPGKKKIVIWFTAVPKTCCDAYWGVAESDDGIHFNLITLTETGDNTPTMLPEGGDRNGGSGSNSMPEYAPHHSRQTARQVMQHQGGGVVGGAIRQQALTSTLARPKDGNALLLDDDGTGYIAYTNLAPGPGKDHMVFIEELEPDLRHAANKTVFGPFPDQFVEGVMFFKRKGVYYIIYSSCCCACREGSGAVVYTAENVAGPWTKQSNDVNCNLPKISTLSLPPPVPSGDRMLAAAPEPALGRGGSSRICAGMPAPAGLPDGPRPTGHIIINAQGFSISTLMSSTGEPIFLWLGQRWMSGPNNNPNCTTLCVGATGACSQDPRYSAGNDFTYLIPLAFEPNGAIKTFAPFVDEFALDLPG